MERVQYPPCHIETQAERIVPPLSCQNGKGRVQDPPCCTEMPTERVAPPPSHQNGKRRVWDPPCCAKMLTKRVAPPLSRQNGKRRCNTLPVVLSTSREGSTPSIMSKWEGECGTFPVVPKCQQRGLLLLHHVEMGVGGCGMEEGCFCLFCCQNECECGGEECQFV